MLPSIEIGKILRNVFMSILPFYYLISNFSGVACNRCATFSDPNLLGNDVSCSVPTFGSIMSYDGKKVTNANS